MGKNRLEVTGVSGVTRKRGGDSERPADRRGCRPGWGGVVVSLPDSLEAGRGEAMPWGRAEAVEKGGGVSLSPTADWTRGEQSKGYKRLDLAPRG